MDLADGELAASDNGILAEAQERLHLSSEAESQNRKEAITALEFSNGDQWPTEIKQDRNTDARPCLTINITDAVVRRIENACRENRPRIKIDPVGDGADIDTAKVLNGLTRHVEVISSADYAYDCATSSAIRGGWGWMSVTNDFVDEMSFDQDLFIQPHRNPFKIYPDPASELPDGSDLNWLIESELMPRTDYRDQYGHLDNGGWNFVGQGDDLKDWSNKEMIRVAKYWRVEKVKDTLLRLSDGRKMLRSKLSQSAQENAALMVVEERPTVRKQVRCYLLTAFKVLKSWDWPGKWIPYVPVYGRELDINGRICRKGVVKDLEDPARMFNYSETAKTEIYALQPKAPWLTAEGQTDGHEGAWRDANRKPTVALKYKPVRLEDGTYAPPPQRQLPPPVAAGFQEWSQGNQSNFMAVAGMPHDPNQDAKGEVVSGIALKRRQGLSDISHFDFYDNFTRSQRQLGRILVDLFPHFYSGERMQRIVRDDGTSEMVTLNERKTIDGIEVVKNNMQVGRYDVTIDTGPGYQTKREESTEAKLELLGTPLGEMVGKSAGDLIVRGMDFENSDEIADRLQAMIPGAQTDPNSDLPPKAQTIIAGLQGQLKDANQKALALELELKAQHGREHIKQEGEDRRQDKELAFKRDELHVDASVKLEDTHTRAVTAHDVAEIQQAGTLLNTHTEAAHNREAAKELLKHAEKAESRSE